MDLQQALQIVAIACAFGDKEVKEAKALIPEGHKTVLDLRGVTVMGTVSRGKGYEVAPTNTLLSKAVLAKLMKRLGCTREAFKVALADAAREALLTDQKVADVLIEDERELLLAIDEVERDVIAKLPKGRRAGSVSVKAVVRIDKTAIDGQDVIPPAAGPPA